MSMNLIMLVVQKTLFRCIFTIVIFDTLKMLLSVLEIISNGSYFKAKSTKVIPKYQLHLYFPLLTEAEAYQDSFNFRQPQAQNPSSQRNK